MKAELVELPLSSALISWEEKEKEIWNPVERASKELCSY